VFDLLATPINSAHVRLSWTPPLHAVGYHVYRAQSAQGPFSQIGDVTTAFFEDLSQIGNSTNWYYIVRPVSACGIETP
jgi:fibronectin type 3 domain-containing protein